jgi:homeobox protein ESX1
MMRMSASDQRGAVPAVPRTSPTGQAPSPHSEPPLGPMPPGRPLPPPAPHLPEVPVQDQDGAPPPLAGAPPRPPVPPRPPRVVKEIGGPSGPEPTRYGDWERKGRVSDF